MYNFFLFLNNKNILINKTYCTLIYLYLHYKLSIFKTNLKYVIHLFSLYSYIMSNFKQVLLPIETINTRHPDTVIQLDKLTKILTIKELNLVGVTPKYKPVLTSSLHSLNNGVYLSVTGLTDKYEYYLTPENIPQIDESNNYIKKNDRELPQEEITIHISFHVTHYDDYGMPYFPSGLHIKSGDFRDFADKRTEKRMKKISCMLINDFDNSTLEIINDYGFPDSKINFWNLQRLLIESVSDILTKYYNYIIIKQEMLLSGEDLYNYRVKELHSIENQIETHKKKIQDIQHKGDYTINRSKYDLEIKHIRDTISLLNMHITKLLGMKIDEFKKIIDEKNLALTSGKKVSYEQKYLKYKQKYLFLKKTKTY